MFGVTFGRGDWTVKAIFGFIILVFVSLVLLFYWGRGVFRDRELAEFRNAQVEEALRQKNAEIEQKQQDLIDIQKINEELKAEVEWARFHVSRREAEIEELKAASSDEVQACLELVVDPAFLP